MKGRTNARSAALVIAAVILARSPAAIAQGTVPIDLHAGKHDAVSLRAELLLQQAARNEARQNKARAYRQARELYQSCSRELRPFCMLSARTMMRDADDRYRENEALAFPNIGEIEKAVARLAPGR